MNISWITGKSSFVNSNSLYNKINHLFVYKIQTTNNYQSFFSMPISYVFNVGWVIKSAHQVMNSLSKLIGYASNFKKTIVIKWDTLEKTSFQGISKKLVKTISISTNKKWRRKLIYKKIKKWRRNIVQYCHATM